MGCKCDRPGELFSEIFSGKEPRDTIIDYDKRFADGPQNTDKKQLEFYESNRPEDTFIDRGTDGSVLRSKRKSQLNPGMTVLQQRFNEGPETRQFDYDQQKPSYYGNNDYQNDFVNYPDYNINNTQNKVGNSALRSKARVNYEQNPDNQMGMGNQVVNDTLVNNQMMYDKRPENSSMEFQKMMMPKNSEYRSTYQEPFINQNNNNMARTTYQMGGDLGIEKGRYHFREEEINVNEGKGGVGFSKDTFNQILRESGMNDKPDLKKRTKKIPVASFKEDISFNPDSIKEAEEYNIRNSKNKFRSKGKIIPEVALPLDDNSIPIFLKINEIRQNPQGFIEEIEKAKQNIGKDYQGNPIYQKDRMRVALTKGEPAFDEAIDILSNTQPMGPLTFNEDLNIELPTNEKDVLDKDYLKDKVRKITDNNIPIRSYWRDLVSDPDARFLLMIVDDNGENSGLKRKDILNPEIKQIGINSGMVGKKFVSYVTLAPEMKA